MRQFTSNIILFLIALLFLTCGDSVSNLSKDDVTLKIENDNLLIQNRFNHSIYYFAVESEVAIAIQWATLSTDKNRVKAGRIKSLPLDSIYAYASGDEIIVYYWSKKEPGNNNMKSQRIETQ